MELTKPGKVDPTEPSEMVESRFETTSVDTEIESNSIRHSITSLSTSTTSGTFRINDNSAYFDDDPQEYIDQKRSEIEREQFRRDWERR